MRVIFSESSIEYTTYFMASVEFDEKGLASLTNTIR